MGTLLEGAALSRGRAGTAQGQGKGCLQQLSLLGSSTRRHLGLSGGDKERGLLGLEGSWDPSQPGPLAAPRIGTGNIHTLCHRPSARAQGQRWPPLALGDASESKGGAGAGKHIQRTRPPIPRHLSHTGMDGGTHGGTRPDLHRRVGPSRAGICRVTPSVPLSLSAPLVQSCARHFTDGVLSPHYVCLSKFNGL